MKASFSKLQLNCMMSLKSKAASITDSKVGSLVGVAAIVAISLLLMNIYFLDI